jgi:hypothetical protein
MLDGARRVFLAQSGCSEQDLIVLMEMTLQNLLAEGQLNHADFLARVDILGALGRTVLVSKFGEYYRLAGYLSRYTNRMIGLVMGVPSLMEIFDEKYYLNLEGGILEALGRMFKGGLKLYVYPMIDEGTGKIVTAKQLEVAPNLRSLFQYLIDNQFIEEIAHYHAEYLRIYPADALAKLQRGTRILRLPETGGGVSVGYQGVLTNLRVEREIEIRKKPCRHNSRYMER